MFIVLAFAAGLITTEPPSLTLADALSQARAASPLRAAADLLATGETEAARLAGRRPNPLFDVRVENFGATPSLPNDVFAVIGQPIELGGKRGLRQAVANGDRDLALANLRNTEAQIALRTARLYVEALKSRGLLETQTANRDALGALIETMRRRVQEGYAAESDLLKFETESARMDIEIIRSQLELNRNLNALTFVIGSPAPVSASQLVEPPVVPAPAIEPAAIAASVSRHPDVAAASARVDRAVQVAALEHARRIPDLIVTFGYKRTSGLDSAVAGVALDVPLFERRGSAAAKAGAEASAAAAERRALTGRLASDAATLVRTAQTLSQRAERATVELLEPANAVRNSALASFQEGRSDVLKLLDAERVYADVRRTILELRLDALAAALDARFALGQEILP